MIGHAVAVQQAAPRLAERDDAEHHQPSARPGSRYVADVDAHAQGSFADRSEGDAAQQMVAQQEGEDRDRQQEQERAGGDHRPVRQAGADLATG